MLNPIQERWCSESRWDFSDLQAVFINCTLKKSPERSHTDGLVDISAAIMEKNAVAVTRIRAVDYPIASGVYPNMTKYGWDRDAWPASFEKVQAAQIVVSGRGIRWTGERLHQP